MLQLFSPLDSVIVVMMGSYGVHPSVGINILPGSGNINTTIKTPYGEVFPMTVSWPGHLLELEDS